MRRKGHLLISRRLVLSAIVIFDCQCFLLSVENISLLRGYASILDVTCNWIVVADSAETLLRATNAELVECRPGCGQWTAWKLETGVAGAQEQPVTRL